MNFSLEGFLKSLIITIIVVAVIWAVFTHILLPALAIEPSTAPYLNIITIVVAIFLFVYVLNRLT